MAPDAFDNESNPTAPGQQPQSTPPTTTPTQPMERQCNYPYSEK